MKRVILDTNIYGELAIDKDVLVILSSLKKSECAVYGAKIIRKELRDTPKSMIFHEEKLRIKMLRAYDFIVGEHNLGITKEIEALSEEYYLTYKNLGGAKGADEMKNDLLIVSCASLNSLDIVVSDDCHSLCSDKALQAYKIVNDLKKIRTPEILHYSEFRRWFV